jgi:hypothetical protein
MEDKYCGIDACGDDIFVGDEILEIAGNVVLVGNAARFLEEFHGAKQKVAQNEE